MEEVKKNDTINDIETIKTLEVAQVLNGLSVQIIRKILSRIECSLGFAVWTANSQE